MYFDWLKGLFGRQRIDHAHPRSPKRRAVKHRKVRAVTESQAVEELESRLLLTNYTPGQIIVSNNADTATPSGTTNLGVYSADNLRSAISYAETLPGNDEISLPGGTYDLDFGSLNITTNIRLVGSTDPANPTIIVGDGSHRVFDVEGTSSSSNFVEFANITIQGGVDTVGAGVYAGNVDLKLDHVTVQNNHAEGSGAYGGGIAALESNLAIQYSTINGNQVAATDSDFVAKGGGIATLQGTLNIYSSTISNNYAFGVSTSGDYGAGIAQGGGIYSDTTSVSIDDSTIAGNASYGGSASGAEGFGGEAYGGGLYFKAGSSAYIYNSTIANNSANGGYGASHSGQNRGGGFYSQINPYLSSSIVAQNAASYGPDIATAIGSSVNTYGDNLVGSSSQWTSNNLTELTDLVNLDPMLDENGLQDNGGPTLTIALQPTSPAINAGNSGENDFDQRGEGFTRIFGVSADIGAFELQSDNHAPTVANLISPQQATEDTPFSFQFDADTFADEDALDTLVYTTSVLPTWLSFDPLTRTFSGTPLNDDVTAGITITVYADDGVADPVPTTFSLSVLNTNDAPTVANQIHDQTATEDTPFLFIIPGNTFSDVDVGDTLTYSVSELPCWLSFDPCTQTFSGTPDNDDVTTDPICITVTVRDEDCERAHSTFELTVLNTNDPPFVANTIPCQTATEDEPFCFTLPCDTFEDVDVGDSLRYSVRNLPSWLSFNCETLTFHGTPTNDDVTCEPICIKVIAKDESCARACTTFDLTVLNTNDAPTVDQGICNKTATEDSFFCFQIPDDAFEDVDKGDCLTYSVTGLPDWLCFHPWTGKFTGTPTNDDVTTVPITITVTATDESGESTFTTFDLTVENTNDAPYVDEGIAPQTATEDEPFAFTIPDDAFKDVDVGDSLTYSVSGMPDWLFFNPAVKGFVGTPTNDDVTFQPMHITVRVTDESGATACTAFCLTVLNTNDAPTVDRGLCDQTATEDEPFCYVFSRHAFEDIDACDTLAYSTSELPEWLDFDPFSRKFSGMPTNDDVTDEPLCIRVTATDESGASVSTWFNITVLNTEDAPIGGKDIVDQTAHEDSPFTFTIPSGKIIDIDPADTLTYSATNLPGWLSFNSATQSFTGTPTQQDVTTQPIVIIVTATDTSDQSASVSFKLSVLNTNDAPTVANVLSNQTATEDSPFSYIIPGSTFADSDPGDVLTLSATGLPGWLSFNPATGEFSGTPLNANVTSQPITITVKATDVAHTFATTTFTVSVINTNDAPTVANPISNKAGIEGTLFSFTVPSNTFADVDVGDTLTYSASGMPAWLSFNAGTRKFTGTPGNGDVTPIPTTITVTATDGSSQSVSTTFGLTVVNTNNPPTFVNVIPNQQATEDTPFSFTVPVDTFIDVDGGDELTYSATGLPAWLSLNPQTGEFSGTPLSGDVTVSPITITVTASDTALAHASTTFTLSVTNVNDAPTVANAIAQQTATEDSLFSFTLPGDIFSDVDAGDTLTLSATGLPGWLSFNPQTGQFTGTPSNSNVTAGVTITVTATDESDATVSTTFTLVVLNTNDAPTVANVISAQQATEDSLFSFTVPLNTFADVDAGDTLSYAATGLPDWLSFDPQTRTFSGTPDDEDNTSVAATITVTATDSHEVSVSTTFQLTITAVNDHDPQFVFETQNATVSEHYGNGQLAATAAATDADLPAETLSYSIVSGNTDGAFSINSATGAIRVANSDALVFATNPSFSLVIRVTDNSGVEPRTSTSTVTINVLEPEQLSGPTLTGGENDITYIVGNSPIGVNTSATFTNQLTPATFAGAQLTVQVSGRLRRDQLGIVNGDQVVARGSRLFYAGTQIGTIAGGNDRSPNLVITFNSSASNAAIDAIVRRVGFVARTTAEAPRVISMQVTNLDGHDSNAISRRVFVAPRSRR